MDENNNLIIGDISVTYVGEGTVPISAACTDGKKCYGTYSSHHAFIVPEGLTVSEIGIDDQKLNVKEYDAGSVVPANTGVMVSAATDGNKTITFTGLDGSSVLGTSNRLRATGSDGVTADAMSTADAGCKYYRLTMHDGTKIGYWWGAAEGAAFDLGANKAYLAVPNNVTVRAGFSFFDEETAIDDVRIEGNGQPADEAAAFSGCYDLQGRRVTTENKRKGLYIVGGKKLVVR